MGVLSKLKAILGIGKRDRGGDYDAAVTVEREPEEAPAAGSERAVKEPAPDRTDEPAADPEADADTGDTPESDAEPTEAEPAGSDAEAVEIIKGIGPAYAERLAAAGVETVADLAAADPATLAEETDIAEGRIETWIERAKGA